MVMWCFRLDNAINLSSNPCQVLVCTKEYPQLPEEAIKILYPFLITYISKRRFSLYTLIKILTQQTE